MKRGQLEDSFWSLFGVFDSGAGETFDDYFFNAVDDVLFSPFCFICSSYLRFCGGTLSKYVKMAQIVFVTQKMYMGMGCASVAIKGEELWLSLARNMGVPRAVAALLTSKMVELATTVMLKALQRPNLQSR